jgi:eukaryotic translation initiation factor 2C
MRVDTSGPLKVNARVLRPPTLKYGQGSKPATIVCGDSIFSPSFPHAACLRLHAMAHGTCKYSSCLIKILFMFCYRMEKKMFRPAEIKHFAVIVYEAQSRFSRDLAQDMINGLIAAARDVG